MPSSTAYIVVKPYDLTYHFTGVTEVVHNLSLKIAEKTDTTESDGYVNGAKKLPDKVTLSVIESDAGHASGWAARMLEAMAALKKNRQLCRVVTSMASYDRMLLSEITATQDEENQDGWSGELVFMEYIPVSSGNSNNKTDNNSSTRRNTGNTGTKKVLTPFQQLLSQALGK